jgi:hypothetical protein
MLARQHLGVVFALGPLVAGCGDDGVPVQHDARRDSTEIDSPDVSFWTMQYQDPSVQLEAIWSSDNTVYAVGSKNSKCLVLHSAGSGDWQEETNGVSTIGGGLFTVWGSGPTDIYAGGFSDTLLHSTGNGVWTPQTIGNLGPFDLWGSGPNDIYFAHAASAGNVYHSTGNGTWSPLMIGTGSSTISTVWGTSASNVYFAGGTGTSFGTPYVVHGPGSPSTETMPTFSDMTLHNIYKLWGSSANDIYGVGNGYAIYHTTGNGTWTLQTGPTTGGGVFEDISGDGPNAIFATSQTGGVYHSTGNGTWTKTNGAPSSPTGIFVKSSVNVYVITRTAIWNYTVPI